MFKKSFKGKKVIVVSISVMVIVLLLSFLIFYFLSKPQQQTSYFFSKDFGIVKIKVVEGIKKDIVQQQARFDKETINLGEKITGSDTFLFEGTNLFARTVNVEIRKEGGQWTLVASEDLGVGDPFPPGVLTTYIDYTPTSIGIYEAQTTYEVALCVPGQSCQSYIDNPKIQNGYNKVNVISLPSCNGKISYWGNWSLDGSEQIWGHNEKRVYYNLNSNTCQETPDNEEFRTLCNNGYKITGTVNDILGSGKTTCVLLNPNTNISQNTTTGCDSDVTTKCYDNSTIIELKCITIGSNKVLNSTGLKCLTILITNQSGSNINLTNNSNGNQLPVLTDVSSGISIWLTLGLIFGSLFLVIVAVLIIRRFI